MAHEVTETWEIDGKWHVKPSVGKKKGKTLKVFDSEKEANKWARKRSDDYKEPMKKRDYKDEYNKFQKDKSGYRAKLNKYNRDNDTYGNGDKKDASHIGGKIVGFESQSKNRGRREKSRKKGFLQKQGLY